LFFGNLYQDWSDFVLADLGLLRYERVPFSSDSRALRHRAEVDLAMALHQCAERLEQGDEPLSILGAMTGLHSDNPWLA
ncbi:VRR-NUC domain-containing protein, partial [Pseudomonas sp. SIMBA_064]